MNPLSTLAPPKPELRTPNGEPRPALQFVATLAETAEKGVVRIPLAVTGTWVRGEQQFSITRADLEAIARNFGGRQNGEINVDYDHASEMPEVAAGGPIPSAGRIVDVEKPSGLGAGGSGLEPKTATTQSLAASPRFILWGWYEPTARARELIRRREYRYISPAIDWGARSKRTGRAQGATLTSVALTNRPFLEELPQIHLSDPSYRLIAEVRSAKLGKSGFGVRRSEFGARTTEPRTPHSQGTTDGQGKFKIQDSRFQNGADRPAHQQQSTGGQGKFKIQNSRFQNGADRPAHQQQSTDGRGKFKIQDSKFKTAGRAPAGQDAGQRPALQRRSNISDLRSQRGGSMKKVQVSAGALEPGAADRPGEEGRIMIGHPDFADEYYADPEEVRQVLIDMGLAAPETEESQKSEVRSQNGEEEPGSRSQKPGVRSQNEDGGQDDDGPGEAREISLSQAAAVLSEAEARGKAVPAAEFFRARVEQSLDEAVKAGKILPRQRQDWRRIALADFPTFAKLMGEQPQRIPLRPLGFSGSAPVDVPTQVKFLAEQRMRERGMSFGQALTEIGREQPALMHEYRRAVSGE